MERDFDITVDLLHQQNASVVVQAIHNQGRPYSIVGHTTGCRVGTLTADIIGIWRWDRLNSNVMQWNCY